MRAGPDQKQFGWDRKLKADESMDDEGSRPSTYASFNSRAGEAKLAWRFRRLIRKWLPNLFPWDQRPGWRRDEQSRPKATDTLTEPSVACDRCEDLCVRYAVRYPRELRRAIQIAAENIADNTLAEVIPDSPWVSVSFDKLATGAAWDDYVEYHFRCLHCNEAFCLRAETYHGGGGYWEPEDPASIRGNITN